MHCNSCPDCHSKRSSSCYLQVSSFSGFSNGGTRPREGTVACANEVGREGTRELSELLQKHKAQLRRQLDGSLCRTKACARSMGGRWSILLHYLRAGWVVTSVCMDGLRNTILVRWKELWLRRNSCARLLVRGRRVSCELQRYMLFHIVRVDQSKSWCYWDEVYTDSIGYELLINGSEHRAFAHLPLSTDALSY